MHSAHPVPVDTLHWTAGSLLGGFSLEAPEAERERRRPVTVLVQDLGPSGIGPHLADERCEKSEAGRCWRQVTSCS